MQRMKNLLLCMLAKMNTYVRAYVLESITRLKVCLPDDF